jgi:hypothetical protein
MEGCMGRLMPVPKAGRGPVNHRQCQGGLLSAAPLDARPGYLGRDAKLRVSHEARNVRRQFG